MADVSRAAVAVPGTFGSTTGDGVRLGDESGFAAANGISDGVDHTESPAAARRRIARVWLFNAFLVLADVPRAAVAVPGTFRTTAGDGIRLGNKPSFASANGVSNRVDHAESSATTGRRITRIGLLNATLLLADISSAAIAIADTFGSTARDRVRLGYQTGVTAADRIS